LPKIRHGLRCLSNQYGYGKQSEQIQKQALLARHHLTMDQARTTKLFLSSGASHLEKLVLIRDHVGLWFEADDEGTRN
jgi:hypothetical protein